MSLTLHPFQAFELEKNPLWSGIRLEDNSDDFVIEQLRALNAGFQRAVETRSIVALYLSYDRVARAMLCRLPQVRLLKPLLENAMRRLVFFFYHRCYATRRAFAQPESVYSWKLESALIDDAVQQAAQMERDDREVQDYDLGQAPELRDWLIREVAPLISNYLGRKVCCPSAHIRYADHSRHGHGWTFFNRYHPYEYFHFDESPSTQPVIVYLSDVDEQCGPFSYLDGSDKYDQNLALRALHTALWCDLNVQCWQQSDKETIARLPRPLRGGNQIGSFVALGTLQAAKVVEVTGPTGTATLFDGFSLAHCGGHPARSMRKALFVAFRCLPRKIDELKTRAAEKIWRAHLSFSF